MQQQTDIKAEVTGTNDVKSSKLYRVLLAEDDYEMRKLLAQALRKAGYDVVECSDGVSMLSHLSVFLLPDEVAHVSVDLIISDIRMPGVTGLEVLEGSFEIEGFPPVIMITAFGDAKTHMRAKRFGAAAVFDKPFDVDVLLQKVNVILSQPSPDFRANGNPEKLNQKQ